MKGEKNEAHGVNEPQLKEKEKKDEWLMEAERITEMKKRNGMNGYAGCFIFDAGR